MGISFTKLGHELCSKCDAYDIHVKEDCTKEESCPACLSQATHKECYRLAREAYKADKKLPYAYSVDLEKVLLLPHMPQYKKVIFTRRMITMNETFARVSEDKRPIAVIWHEGIAGRVVNFISYFFSYET